MRLDRIDSQKYKELKPVSYFINRRLYVCINFVLKKPKFELTWDDDLVSSIFYINLKNLNFPNYRRKY